MEKNMSNTVCGKEEERQHIKETVKKVKQWNRRSWMAGEEKVSRGQWSIIMQSWMTEERMVS